MAFLLDTHIFYWVLLDSPLLRQEHRDLLSTTQDEIFVSAVTGWEIATKVRIGRWPEAAPLLPGLEQIVERAGLSRLMLSMAQAERAGTFAVDHKDPFDRLLAAQALDLGLTLVTVDPAMKLFGCSLT